MAGDSTRYVVPYVVGLAPPLLVALSWSPAGQWSLFELVMRDQAAPVVGAELFVIVVALRDGLLKALPRWNWSRLVVAAAVALLAVAVATAAFAPVRVAAAILTARWIVHAVFGLSVLHLCGRAFSGGDLIRAYLVGFAIFAAEFFLFISQIPDWAAFEWVQGLPAFSHIRHAGYYLAAMAGLGIGVMAISQSRREWAWAFASACLATGIALWTGSRGAVLAVAVALAVSMLFSPAMRSMKAWAGGVAALVLAGVVTSQIPAPHPMMGASRMVGATVNGNPTTGRTDMWEIVIRAIRERPLFGYGDGQMHQVATFSTMVQPHNSLLQVTLAWGIAGLLCVLILAFAYGRRAIPALRRETGAIVPAFVAMAAIAILSLYDGALFYPLPTSIFVACAAVIASRWRPVSVGRESSASPDLRAVRST